MIQIHSLILSHSQFNFVTSIEKFVLKIISEI